MENFLFINYNINCTEEKRGDFSNMNTNQSKILLPNDVRKLLNVDNKEIVEFISNI